MTADAITATKSRGRPFAPGNNANPSGRPKKGHALRDYVRNLPTRTKREIVEVAVQEILENHDVAWAGWLLKAEGVDGPTAGLVRELIVRQYAFDPSELD